MESNKYLISEYLNFKHMSMWDATSDMKTIERIIGNVDNVESVPIDAWERDCRGIARAWSIFPYVTNNSPYDLLVVWPFFPWLRYYYVDWWQTYTHFFKSSLLRVLRDNGLYLIWHRTRLSTVVFKLRRYISSHLYTNLLITIN